MTAGRGERAQINAGHDVRLSRAERDGLHRCAVDAHVQIANGALSALLGRENQRAQRPNSGLSRAEIAVRVLFAGEIGERPVDRGLGRARAQQRVGDERCGAHRGVVARAVKVGLRATRIPVHVAAVGLLVRVELAQDQRELRIARCRKSVRIGDDAQRVSVTVATEVGFHVRQRALHGGARVAVAGQRPGGERRVAQRAGLEAERLGPVAQE